MVQVAENARQPRGASPRAAPAHEVSRLRWVAAIGPRAEGNRRRAQGSLAELHLDRGRDGGGGRDGPPVDTVHLAGRGVQDPEGSDGIQGERRWGSKGAPAATEVTVPFSRPADRPLPVSEMNTAPSGPTASPRGSGTAPPMPGLPTIPRHPRARRRRPPC